MPTKSVTPPPAARSQNGYSKSADARARILAAALEEANEAGLHKASLAGIAGRAGFAIGNLHYHFGSRDRLLREMMDWLIGDLMARLHAVDIDDGADFFDRQRRGLLVYLEYLRAYPGHIGLADQVKLHEPDLYRRAVAAWVERMAERIRAGIEEGSLRPMDEAGVTAQAHFLLGARHFLEQMTDNSDGTGDEAIVDAYLTLLRDGLGRGRQDTRTRERAKARTSKQSSRSGRSAQTKE